MPQRRSHPLDVAHGFQGRRHPSFLSSASTSPCSRLRNSGSRIVLSPLVRGQHTEQVRAASSDAGKDFPAFAGVSVKQTELGECRVRLEVTVPVSVLEAAYAACIESCAETAQIPGFTFKKGGSRKKKEDHLPPADILVGSVGEKEFRSACVEEMLQNSIPVGHPHRILRVHQTRLSASLCRHSNVKSTTPPSTSAQARVCVYPCFAPPRLPLSHLYT